MADMNWIGQLKYNGTRILVKYLPSLTGRSEDVPVELWNRHGNRLWNYMVPEDLLGQLRDLHSYLPISSLETSILDGELIDMKHKALKDTIAIWDILVKDSEHLVGSTYQERYDLIAPTAQDYVFSAPHGEFVFGKLIGTGRTFGQHEVADVGVAVPHPHFFPSGNFDAKFRQQPARVFDRAGAGG